MVFDDWESIKNVHFGLKWCFSKNEIPFKRHPSMSYIISRRPDWNVNYFARTINHLDNLFGRSYSLGCYMSDGNGFLEVVKDELGTLCKLAVKTDINDSLNFRSLLTLRHLNAGSSERKCRNEEDSRQLRNYGTLNCKLTHKIADWASASLHAIIDPKLTVGFSFDMKLD